MKNRICFSLPILVNSTFFEKYDKQKDSLISFCCEIIASKRLEPSKSLQCLFAACTHSTGDISARTSSQGDVRY